MNLLNNSNISTLLVGAVFMGIVFTISYVRNMEAKRLRNKLGESDIVLSGFNVHFYGVESVEGKPLKSIGALALSGKGLYYRARYTNLEIFISGKQMTSIIATDDFKGKNMYGNIVAINFVNDNGVKDRAAFRIPYPERWSKAINELYFS